MTSQIVNLLMQKEENNLFSDNDHLKNVSIFI